MPLKSLSYLEYEGEPRFWRLDGCDFTQINLIVGRNSTGKTRLINVIGGLCKLLTAQHTSVFDSGTYEAEIVFEDHLYSLYFEFRKGKVIKERLDVDGVTYLTRGEDGRGKILYAQLAQFVDFQVPSTVIAIQQRQDELQHPYIVKLAKWAVGCKTYSFGSSLGRDVLVSVATLQSAINREGKASDNDDLVTIYSRAFGKHGDNFDKALIRDMKTLGYPLLDVGADDVRALSPGLLLPEPVFGMFVVEEGRAAKLPQMQMSQGMFRALALVVHMNVASFDRQRSLVLVDDIGEGLDYERSAGLIDLLIRHAKESEMQLIMTSNDRFVMNRVPLEHWMLLRRTGPNVRAYTERNSPTQFAEFKFMGLSNFDLFASELFQ